MADWAVPNGIGAFRAPSAVSSTSSGITVTTGSSAHTKGSWTEITASSPIDADEVIAMIRGGASADTLTDIAVGAAGSEVVVFSNLYEGAGVGSSLSTGAIYRAPIAIAAGTRISARSQGHGAFQGLTVDVYLLKGGVSFPSACGRVTAYGASTEDSGGVQIDPGTTLNTKGAYSEITSATTTPIKALIAAFPLVGDGARADAHWLIDIAVGAAGSETVVLQDFHVTCSSATDAHYPQATPTFPVAIPAGTRLAVRAQCSITTSDRLFDAIIYGVD